MYILVPLLTSHASSGGLCDFCPFISGLWSVGIARGGIRSQEAVADPRLTRSLTHEVFLLTSYWLIQSHKCKVVKTTKSWIGCIFGGSILCLDFLERKLWMTSLRTKNQKMSTQRMVGQSSLLHTSPLSTRKKSYVYLCDPHGFSLETHKTTIVIFYLV